MVLANLCVCYLVTSQNEEAEELLRKLEKEEEQRSLDNPQSKFFHLSIVNLVIGFESFRSDKFEMDDHRICLNLPLSGRSTARKETTSSEFRVLSKAWSLITRNWALIRGKSVELNVQ